MQGTRQFLELVRDHDLVAGSLRGVFHIAIGRRILDAGGQVITSGVTWRELAALLKELKFDRELVRELSADPETLSPKDREKFWYNAITIARVDGEEARQQAEVLTHALRPHGLRISPAPGGTPKAPLPPPEPTDVADTPKPNAGGKKRRKP